MIQAVRNNYNINFKSEINSASNVPQKVQELISVVSQTSAIRQHLLALDTHGIKISAVGLKKNNAESDRIYLCYKSKKVDGSKNNCLDLTDASSGKVETSEDAEKLMNNIIQRAWRAFINYYKYDLNMKLH